MTLSLRSLHVRDQHLDVAVTTEATFFGPLADVHGAWVAKPRLANILVDGTELSKNRQEPRRLIIDDLMLDQSTITTDAVDDGDLRSDLQLSVERIGHFFFISIRTKLAFLQHQVSAAYFWLRDQGIRTPRRALRDPDFFDFSFLPPSGIKTSRMVLVMVDLSEFERGLDLR